MVQLPVPSEKMLGFEKGKRAASFLLMPCMLVM